ncbi:MAG: DeoR/GlpR transcriptional regulator [Planctomycetales bacterium]|nr:DeoR/GlpR transcriptional regulator [Planctomycetales bacterium]MCA9167551.1 DeoR/GlpR transcriptional regulator [Planctomycetales bacterium]
MPTEERRARLLEIVRQQGFASLEALAAAMEVSPSTIRRDLDSLEDTGEAKRTHGGVFYTGPSPKLPHFEQRQRFEWEKKKQIAACAAELVQDGDTILLDGGSTTYELAQRLVPRSLQIVTNSLPVATLFTSVANHDLVLIGGYVHQRTGVCLGPYANQMLTELSVRRAFLSVAGISERGCFNSNLLLVETEQAMIRAADEVIVLADSTKFGHQSLALMCELTEIDTLIVDSEISDSWRDKLLSSGVNLRIASARVTPSEEPRK